MKVFFFGDLRSPFIKQDREILAEDNEIFTYDISPYTKMGKMRNILHPLNSLLCAPEIWKADLVWCWFVDYPVLPQLVLAKLFRKPIVIHIGGWEIYNAPEIQYGNQRNIIRGWISRQIIQYSTRCITPTEIYKNVALKLVPGCKPVVIPNFVDTSLCDADIPEKEPLCVTALCAMSAAPVKGVSYFEAAAKILKSQGIEFRVINGLSRSDYIKILQRAQVYCQLSYLESFGVSLVEAMACGCVPVVSNRDALPWIAGGSGIVVPYGDPVATAKAIKKAMGMDGSEARERARYFSREKKQANMRLLIKDLTAPTIETSVPSEPFEV